MKLFASSLLLMLSFAIPANAQRPGWISSKPNVDGFYVGVGSASKRMGDFAGIAKKNALQDLVSEIRITISSTSILSQIDKNSQFKEEYESNIKTIAAAEIQDFERVDSYEDEQSYWVYYRLSKANYQAQKQKSLSDVKTMALQFFEKAVQAEQNNTIATAIDFYFRSLLTLKDYWGENVEVIYQGKSTLLAIECYARLQQLLDVINIKPAANTVRLGGSGNARLTFTIANRAQVLQKIPVLLTSSPARATPTAYVSDDRGEVNVLFSAALWNNTMREAELTLDLKAFAKASAEERFYDYLIRSLRVPSAKVGVDVAQNARVVTGDYFPFFNGLVMADFSNASRYTFNNLRLVPLRMKDGFREAVGQMGFYVSLHEAMLNNKLIITETSTSGSVNTLIGRNVSSDTLFIMSGEILTGGKQDRVVARDMLIPPGEGRVKIPVFCVEKGRWKYKGSGNGQQFTEYYGMANEHLRDIIDHQKTQQDVWNEVSKSNSRDGVNSSTDAYTDHASNRTFRRAEQEYVDFFQSLFANDPTVIGVMSVTGTRVEGVDLFINNSLFVQEYPKLLYSYIDEAITYGAPLTITASAMENYINQLLDPASQGRFIEERGQAFRKGQQVIHISTY
jgi:hypothetical protein